MPEVSPSVLIIRLDAIGDALALTPLLAEFRRLTIPVDVVLSRADAGVFTARAARRAIVADFALRSSDRSNLAAIERFGRSLACKRLQPRARRDGGSGRISSWRPPSARRNSHRLYQSMGQAVQSVVGTAAAQQRGSFVRAGLDPRAPHESEVLFLLGRSLVGAGPPTHELARFARSSSTRAPEPDERVAVQVTDKWERLGIAFDRSRRDGSPRCGEASSAPAFVREPNPAYAQRVGEATALHRQLLRRDRSVEECHRRSAGDRHSGFGGAPCRRHGGNARRRGLSAPARLCVASRTLGALGRAASHRSRRSGLARARRRRARATPRPPRARCPPRRVSRGRNGPANQSRDRAAPTLANAGNWKVRSRSTKQARSTPSGRLRQERCVADRSARDACTPLPVSQRSRTGRKRRQEPIERGVARLRAVQVETRMERVGNGEFHERERGAPQGARLVPAQAIRANRDRKGDQHVPGPGSGVVRSERNTSSAFAKRAPRQAAPRRATSSRPERQEEQRHEMNSRKPRRDDEFRPARSRASAGFQA